MKDFKTLTQIRNELNVSRKVIQGYEKHGLIRQYGKDAYGHLLYDEETYEKITWIRFYQKLGFELNEIRVFIDRPLHDSSKIFEEKRNDLIRQADDLMKKSEILDDLAKGKTLERETILRIVKEEE